MQHVMDAGLVRGVRRWDVVGFMINATIGAGIYAFPSKVFALSGIYSIFAVTACAAVIALLMLCFAEVSSRFTATGGPYLYAEQAFGPTVGFTVGWLTWMSRLSGFALISNVIVSHLSFFWEPANTGLARVLVIAGIAVLLAIINIIGVSPAAVACDLFAIAKLIPLMLFIAVGIFFVAPQNYSVSTSFQLGSFSQAVSLLIIPFTGFELAFIAAGEVRDPQRNFLFSLPIALTVAAVTYTLIQIVCIGTLPDLSSSETPLADASSNFLGTGAATVMTIGLLVSATGTLNASLLSGPRLLFAMSECGQIPRAMSCVHPRFHTPHIAIMITAGIAFLLAVSGTFIYLASINAITKLLTAATTCGALPVLRSRTGAPPASYRLPGGVLIAFAAIASCIWLLAYMGWDALRDVGIAATAGLVLHILFKMRQRRLRSSLPEAVD
jgi:amino acid transporter